MCLSFGEQNGGLTVFVFLQVNKEIVSGLKYVQQTSRKGVKSESSFNSSTDRRIKSVNMAAVQSVGRAAEQLAT